LIDRRPVSLPGDRRSAQLAEAEATMALHTATPEGKCARCVRVGLDHTHPCGPYEMCADIAGRAPAPRRGGAHGWTHGGEQLAGDAAASGAGAGDRRQVDQPPEPGP